MKMMGHENWEESSLLPHGWLFRVASDGWTKDKKFHEHIVYLSSEGLPFESMKLAMEYMSSSNKYAEKDLANCKEFLLSRSKSDKSFDWEEGDDTIPMGWKMRTCDTDSQRPFFLSPQNLQYRSRYVAVVDMIKRRNAYTRKQVEQMKQLMIKHENWETSDLLPQGWLFKVKCEGFTKDKKYYETIHYLSSEGQTLESLKGIIEHMSTSEYYTETDIVKAKEFVSNRINLEKSYDWREGDGSVPRGWKMRTSETENKWTFILSPDGYQYRSRYVALLDMFKRHKPKADIEVMKELMIEHESWERSELLPAGFLFKVVSEGYDRQNTWWSTLHYISNDGKTFESMKAVIEFMESSGKFTNKCIENCRKAIKEVYME